MPAILYVMKTAMHILQMFSPNNLHVAGTQLKQDKLADAMHPD